MGQNLKAVKESTPLASEKEVTGVQSRASLLLSETWGSELYEQEHELGTGEHNRNFEDEQWERGAFSDFFSWNSYTNSMREVFNMRQSVLPRESGDYSNLPWYAHTSSDLAGSSLRNSVVAKNLESCYDITEDIECSQGRMTAGYVSDFSEDEPSDLDWPDKRNNKLILGTVLDVSENLNLEFKERKDDSAPLSFALSKYNSCGRYLCAFLNTEGGSLLYGISDDGKVTGIKMNRKEMDKINLSLDTIVHQHLEPHPSNGQIVSYFHDVYTPTGEKTNRKVVEFRVPKGDQTLYEFQGRAWKKYNGSVLRMKLEEKKKRITDQFYNPSRLSQHTTQPDHSL